MRVQYRGWSDCMRLNAYSELQYVQLVFISQQKDGMNNIDTISWENMVFSEKSIPSEKRP